MVHRRSNQHASDLPLSVVLFFLCVCVCCYPCTCCNTESWDLCLQKFVRSRYDHIIMSMQYRTASIIHVDWATDIAMDPGVTLENHMLCLSLFLEITKYSHVYTLLHPFPLLIHCSDIATIITQPLLCIQKITIQSPHFSPEKLPAVLLFDLWNEVILTRGPVFFTYL